MYTDRPISCVDCGQEFSFTAGEQEFYAQRGFTESPKRCPSCRQIRKAQRNRGSGDSYGASAGGGSYGGSYGGGYDSPANGNDGGSGGYSSGYGERRQREMFDAVCANCGKTASVPFRPSGARPVYCSDCFESRR